MKAQDMCCPVFHPTEEQFKNFSAYIEEISSKCDDIGICKIVPPKDWFNCDYSMLDIKIPTPVRQCISGKRGVFTVDLVEGKAMTISQFKEIACQIQKLGDSSEGYDKLERKFWRSLRATMPPPLYGADIPGTIFGENPSPWNLNKLDTILRDVELPGVSSSMLYIGMDKSMFALHVEDLNLYSINYVHHGREKMWYAIPRSQATRLERLAQDLYPDLYMKCKEFLRHKTCIISPSRLHLENIPFTRVVQQPGEFVITFPLTYHMGFNLGFNIAEAVNFGALDWIPYAKLAKICICRPGSVRIDMNEFIQELHSSSGRYPAQEQSSTTKNGWEVFHCSCGSYSCTKLPSSVLSFHESKGKTYQCYLCHIHNHLKCTFPQYANEPNLLPPKLRCKQCCSISDNYITATSISSSDENDFLSSSSPFPSSHPSLSPSSHSFSSSHSLMKKPKEKLVKGQYVKIKGKLGNQSNTRIVDIQEGQVRIHVKGHKSEQDEWHPMKSCVVISKERLNRKRKSIL